MLTFYSLAENPRKGAVGYNPAGVDQEDLQIS